MLAVSTITLLAVTMSANPGEDEVIDDTNTTNPLLLISLDGFRSDYIFHQLPTLAAMAKNGVTTRFMVPSYPTITFPNHYTIVTVSGSALRSPSYTRCSLPNIFCLSLNASLLYGQVNSCHLSYDVSSSGWLSKAFIQYLHIYLKMPPEQPPSVISFIFFMSF